LRKKLGMIKKVLKVIAVFVCLGGIVWFLLPIKRNAFSLGSVFGECMCVTAIFLLFFYKKITKKGGWKKVILRFTAFFYVASLFWFSYLTILMNSAQSAVPPENTNVIVLGAQVFGPETMGISLAGRVGRAQEYLEEFPQTIAIVTGGQGYNEPCTEALTQKNVLVKRGVDENRIYMEDKSKNTRENLVNALDIARQKDFGNRFAIATQSFHMFRAIKLAEEVGIEAYSLPAKTDSYIFPAYYGRELLSLTKWHFEVWFTDTEKGED